MSYLGQEIMGFGKPSRLVENILNGTDNIVYTKRETPNPRQCPNCGSTAQVKVLNTEFEAQGDHIVKYTTYGCGCKHLWITSTVYQQTGEELIEDQASQTLA